MTTVAYLAVAPDGQGAPAEIVVRPEAVAGLRRLADAVHAEGAAVSAQIGHAGPVAAGTGHTGLAPSRQFSAIAMNRACWRGMVVGGVLLAAVVFNQLRQFLGARRAREARARSG